MDNLPAHKAKEVRKAIESVGARVESDGVTGGLEEKLDKDFKHWSKKR